MRGWKKQSKWISFIDQYCNGFRPCAFLVPEFKFVINGQQICFYCKTVEYVRYRTPPTRTSRAQKTDIPLYTVKKHPFIHFNLLAWTSAVDYVILLHIILLNGNGFKSVSHVRVKTVEEGQNLFESTKTTYHPFGWFYVFVELLEGLGWG